MINFRDKGFLSALKIPLIDPQKPDIMSVVKTQNVLDAYISHLKLEEYNREKEYLLTRQSGQSKMRLEFFINEGIYYDIIK